MKRITVKFLVDYSPYSTGEVATFFEREANRLIDRGFACVHDLGEKSQNSAADRLKNLARPPQTRHIPGPENTRDQKGPENTPPAGNEGKPTRTRSRSSQVEGAGNKAKRAGRNKAGGK